MPDLDLEAIRKEAASVGVDAGWENSWDHVPNDVQAYPALVVGVPEEITYIRTLVGGGTVTLPITVAVSYDDPEDAQRRLDAALSVNVDGSLVNWFFTHVGVAWSSVEILRGGDYRLVKVGSSKDGKALAADLTIKFSV